MKYIPILNEDWYNDMLEDYQKAFEDIAYKLSHYNNNFAPSESVITASEIVHEGKEYPFPFAVKLEKMYLWMCGQTNRPEGVEDIMDEIIRLVWFNPFVDYTEILEIPWDRWTGLMSSYIGQFYRFAQISLKIEKEERMNATDLALISGLSAAAVGKQIKEGKIRANKSGTEWKVEAEDVKKWLDIQNKKMN